MSDERKILLVWPFTQYQSVRCNRYMDCSWLHMVYAWSVNSISNETYWPRINHIRLYKTMYLIIFQLLSTVYCHPCELYFWRWATVRKVWRSNGTSLFTSPAKKKTPIDTIYYSCILTSTRFQSWIWKLLWYIYIYFRFEFGLSRIR